MPHRIALTPEQEQALLQLKNHAIGVYGRNGRKGKSRDCTFSFCRRTVRS